MFKKLIYITITVTLLVWLGCSGSGGSLPSMPDYGPDSGSGLIGTEPALGESPGIREVVNDFAGHITWGLYQFTADPVKETLDAIQLRTGEVHLNGLRFLEPPPNVYLSVENVQFNGNIIDIDVGLRHPFLGLNEFTGFDVCGILISNGSYTGFTDSNIIYAGPGDTRILNADGHSRWWNPIEFPENPDAPIYGYLDGLLGTSNDIGQFNSTLNGYKYFCDDLDDANDPMGDVTVEGRGVFSSGQKNVRHYTIELGSEGLVFNYAVDANWKYPTGNPPWTIPDDFGPNANRAEPWNISVTEVSNTLYFEEGEGGGSLNLMIEVYDWFNADQNVLYVESADGTIPQTGPALPVGGGPGYSTYEIDIIDAYPTTTGDIDILITAESEADDFQGFLPGIKTSAYLIHTTTVSGEGPEDPIEIDDNDCYGTAIAIDENNVIHSAYADKDNLYWSYSTDKGVHWTNLDSIYIPDDDLKIQYNSLIMSAGPDDGYVYIAWAESAGTGTWHRAVMAGRMPVDLSGGFHSVMAWERTWGGNTNQHYDNAQILALQNGEFVIYSLFKGGMSNFNPTYSRVSGFDALEDCSELYVYPTNGTLAWIYTPYTPSLAADSNSDVFYANSGRFNHDGNVTGSFLLKNTGDASSNSWSFFTSYHHSGSSMFWDNRSNGIFIDESDKIYWVSEYQTGGTGPYGNNSGTYHMVYGEGPSDGDIILQDPIPDMERTVPEAYENAHHDYEWQCTNVVEDGDGLTYVIFQDCWNRRDAYFITWDGTDWHHTSEWVKINTTEDQNAYMPYAIRGLDGYIYVTYTDLPYGGGPGHPVFMAIKDE